MRRPKLLDLFCCAGGAAMGYYRAGFDVVGVDIDPQPHYPFEFHQADAIDFLKEHTQEFDVIHASPPCQNWMGLQDVNRSNGKKVDYPDFIDRTRQALIETGKPFVIENVQKSPLKTTIIICGASLGLRNVMRHRHFESNVLLFAPKCTHRHEPAIYGVYGNLDGRKISFKKEYRDTYAARDIEHARQLLGIDWMDDGEIQEAIPPIYTEYIGKQLMQYLNAKVYATA